MVTVSYSPFIVTMALCCSISKIKQGIGRKFRRYVYSFWHDPRAWQTDRRTDTTWRHIPRLCIAPRGTNRHFTYPGLHYRAMLCISAVCRYPVSVRLSVCPSVTFVSCAKMNKDILEILSPSGGQATLAFPYQTGWRYSDGNPPNGGVECKGVWKKWRFSTNISLCLRNGYS